MKQTLSTAGMSNRSYGRFPAYREENVEERDSQALSVGRSSMNN